VAELVGHDAGVGAAIGVVEPLHVTVQEDRVLQDLVAVDVHILRQRDARMKFRPSPR
jgi:hypothetical protein